MEIFKRFRSWFSLRKEDPETTNPQNEEENSSKKERNAKRNADPITDEESVRRKLSKKDTTTELIDKTHEEHVNNISVPNENLDVEDEDDDEAILSDYEIETIENIHKIRDNCREFDNRICNFKDVMGSKQFLYVDESLQRNIENLDRIDAKESTTIRSERRNAIKYIHLLTERLEAIAKKNQDQLKPKQHRVHFQQPPISREQFLEGKKEE